MFCMPGHWLIFASLVTQYLSIHFPTVSPLFFIGHTHLSNTAHLFLITSCHYWSPRLPLSCGHSVSLMSHERFSSTRLQIDIMLSTLPCHIPGKHLNLSSLTCFCEFWSLPACPCRGLAFRLWALSYLPVDYNALLWLTWLSPQPPCCPVQLLDYSPVCLKSWDIGSSLHYHPNSTVAIL